MQAVSTSSGSMPKGGRGLGRRFRPAGTLATDLVAEEYLAKHIGRVPLYAAGTRQPRGRQQQQPSPLLPFDDNVHNRFHRQKAPLRNPLVVDAAAAAAPPAPAGAAAAAAAAPAARPQRQPRACCSGGRTVANAQEQRRQSKRCGCGPEDTGRKGVLGARLRKQQQQQQDHQGGGWRAQVEREEQRRASRKDGEGSGSRRGGEQHGRRAPAAVAAAAAAAASAFRRAYDDGRLPCSIQHHPMGGLRGNKIKWHTPPEVGGAACIASKVWL